MTDDDIRRANIATCGVSPQRATELLENMRRAGVTEWPWMCSDPYGSLWLRLIEDVGETSGYGTGPDFVAVQDWPCEPGARPAHRPDHPAAPGLGAAVVPGPVRAVLDGRLAAESCRVGTRSRTCGQKTLQSQMRSSM
jgi:hypothetical protein